MRRPSGAVVANLLPRAFTSAPPPVSTELPPADETEQDQEHTCETLLMCIVTVLSHGLRSGGGVGDVLRKPSKEVAVSPGWVVGGQRGDAGTRGRRARAPPLPVCHSGATRRTGPPVTPKWPPLAGWGLAAGTHVHGPLAPGRAPATRVTRPSEPSPCGHRAWRETPSWLLKF